MLHSYLLSLLLLLAVCLSGVDAQQKTSAWQGNLEVAPKTLRLKIEIVDNDGVLSGELTSLDQGSVKLPIDDIELTSKKMKFSIRQLNAHFVGDLDKDAKVASGTFTQSGREIPLELKKLGAKGKTADAAPSKETLKAAWIGKLAIGGMEPVMQFRVVETAEGKSKAYFDSITEGLTGFDATWSLKGDQLNFDVARINLTYRGTVDSSGNQVEGIWSQGGRSLPLTLKKKTKVYDSENVWANRPQRPVGPFPYDELKVTFPNKKDSITLAGTLTVPKKPGKHPVVVLISGSGPQDRDETIMEHKPFLVLADYLTRRGIAVLRYDDRGTAESTGKFATATTEDFAVDAAAAVGFLKAHPRINSAEIGLAGHSEGGLIAPMVVGLRDDVAFVVLLAATGVDGVSISQSQVRTLLSSGGVSEEDIKFDLSVNQAVIDVALNVKPNEDISIKLEEAIDRVVETLPEPDREAKASQTKKQVKSQIKQLQRPWTQFFWRYDPQPALSAIQCPVLAITGSKDLQVVPKLNVPKIREALEKGGNQDFEMVTLDGLNHLFQKCETGAMSEYIGIQETFNEEAMRRISDWIIKRTTVR